jgi:3-phenylpropionate/cinnamic acid dioxygenase small subunit
MDMQILELSRQTVEDFLFLEAELIDSQRFEEWHALFTPDGRYFVPLSDNEDTVHQAAIINDDPLRLEERVYHLARVPFPSQSPRSRTLHLVTNVRVRPSGEGPGHTMTVVSNQLIVEMRVGDFRQVGLGEQRSFAAEVEHQLQPQGDELKIAMKTVRLLNRGGPVSNLTFLL